MEGLVRKAMRVDAGESLGFAGIRINGLDSILSIFDLEH
jgi:hypothetical protein